MKIKTLLLGAVASTALASAATAERGADGNVSIIYWQAPSILNPFLSGGTKDVESASLIVEPLARYDENGTIVEWLSDGVPTVENGGVSEDLTSITWKIKPGSHLVGRHAVHLGRCKVHRGLLHGSGRWLCAADQV